MGRNDESLIKELRERTGVGMSACKNALVETDGNMDAAIEYLRKQGLANAAKKAGRIAAEGCRYVEGKRFEKVVYTFPFSY